MPTFLFTFSYILIFTFVLVFLFLLFFLFIIPFYNFYYCYRIPCTSRFSYSLSIFIPRTIHLQSPIFLYSILHFHVMFAFSLHIYILFPSYSQSFHQHLFSIFFASHSPSSSPFLYASQHPPAERSRR